MLEQLDDLSGQCRQDVELLAGEVAGALVNRPRFTGPLTAPASALQDYIAQAQAQAVADATEVGGLPPVSRCCRRSRRRSPSWKTRWSAPRS